MSSTPTKETEAAVAPLLADGGEAGFGDGGASKEITGLRSEAKQLAKLALPSVLIQVGIGDCMLLLALMMCDAGAYGAW
jgi:hypothetical protein